MAEPDANQTTPPEGFVNPDGGLVEGWQGRLSDESLRTEASLEGYKDINGICKSLVSTKKMMGRDPDTLVTIPNESSTDEERAEFHRRRGVPDTVEGYKYVRGKDLPETIETSDEKIAAFAQIAKKWNLTDEVFNGVANDYLALIGKDIAAFDLIEQDRGDKEFKEAETALKKKFGGAYDEKVARANLLLKKYLGQEMVAELGLENHPAMTEFLDRIAEDMSEDRIKGLTKVSTPTPDAVKDKIIELRKHPAFMDESHPQHKDIVDEISELYKKKSA